MNIYIFNAHKGKIPNSDNWLKKYQYNLIYSSSDEKANLLFSNKKPDVIFTIGEKDASFPVLYAMPLYIRKRWTHFPSLDKITPSLIESYFIGALESSFKRQLGPKVSVFTPTFKSGHKIMRPFNSLRNQTEKEWEWIILDDSPDDDNPDEKGQGETWNRLKSLAEEDCRIRIFRQKGNDSYIGSVKHCTASMARGLYILELDHDDDLLPTALADLVEVFEKNPDVDMVGSDFTEIFEESLDNFSYGSYFGYGRHGYYKERITLGGVERWVNVARNGALDRYTLRHIVGVLNHLRAWRYSTYTKLRGHDYNLNVVDDYELILRTFLHGKIARLPKLLYVQYRNAGGNNFTFLRNDLIQKLVRLICNIYDVQIHERLLELGLEDFEEDENGHYNCFTQPANCYLCHYPDPSADVVLDLHPERVSIIMCTDNQDASLRRAVCSVLQQDFPHWILYIIGDKCPTLEETMQDPMMHDPRIRYWNMEDKRGENHTHSRNYALKILASTDYIAYLDADKYWEPNHLSSLYNLVRQNITVNGTTVTCSAASYAVASFKTENYTVICSEPKLSRVSTSCILHRRDLLEKYGYWQTISDVGYAHDYELVSRWIEENEPYSVSLQPTVNFSLSDFEMEVIYNKYDDQKHHQRIIKEEEDNTEEPVLDGEDNVGENNVEETVVDGENNVEEPVLDGEDNVEEEVNVREEVNVEEPVLDGEDNVGEEPVLDGENNVEETVVNRKDNVEEETVLREEVNVREETVLNKGDDEEGGKKKRRRRKKPNKRN